MKNFKLSLLCCLISAFSFADIAKSEKDALIAFYNATNGKSWVQTWDLSQPMSKWFGLTFKNDKIVGINLSFNNLLHIIILIMETATIIIIFASSTSRDNRIFRFCCLWSKCEKFT